MIGAPAHDVGGDLGRPVALLVPREQIAGQAEPERQEQQGHAEPPVDLAGRAIAPAHKTWRRCMTSSTTIACAREVVHAADEPAAPHLLADVEDTRPGGRRRRAVRGHQEEPGKRPGP